MNVIDVDNHNKLPAGALQCYILLSPEEAAAEYTKRFGEPPAQVWRVTVRGKHSLWLEHGVGKASPLGRIDDNAVQEGARL